MRYYFIKQSITIISPFALETKTKTPLGCQHSFDGFWNKIDKTWHVMCGTRDNRNKTRVDQKLTLGWRQDQAIVLCSPTKLMLKTRVVFLYSSNSNSVPFSQASSVRSSRGLRATHVTLALTWTLLDDNLEICRKHSMHCRMEHHTSIAATNSKNCR